MSGPTTGTRLHGTRRLSVAQLLEPKSGGARAPRTRRRRRGPPRSGGVAVAGTSHRHQGSRPCGRGRGRPPRRGGGILQASILHGPNRQRRVRPAAPQLQRYPRGHHRLKRRTCRRAAAQRRRGPSRRAARRRRRGGGRRCPRRRRRCRPRSLAAAVAEGPILAAEPPQKALPKMRPAAAEAAPTLPAGPPLPSRGAPPPPAALLQLHLRLRGAPTAAWPPTRATSSWASRLSRPS